MKGNTNTKKIAVNVRKLDTILAAHYPEVEEIDIVSVDVEGWELTVMRGLTFEKYRPKVVILENLFFQIAIPSSCASVDISYGKRLAQMRSLSARI